MFGLVTCLQGFVQSYGGLLATRFFLGVFEAGMSPACSPKLICLLNDKEFSLAVFISSQCGINEKRRRKGVLFSSALLHWLEPSVVCWRVPLEKWMACKGLKGGGGFSYWVGIYDS